MAKTPEVTQNVTDKMDELRAARQGRGERVAAPAAPPAAPVAVATAPVEPAKTVESPGAPAVAAAAPSPDPVVAQPAAPAPDPATPTTVDIVIDGRTVAVTPEIAQAFDEAKTIQEANAKASERESLVNDIAAKVREGMQPPPKTEAELAAERALVEASRIKMPDSKLLIEDPDQFNKQLALYIEQQNKIAKDEAKAEVLGTIHKQTQTDAVRAEAYAREQLTEQFYRQYGVFRGSESVVNGIIETKFKEVMASGKLNKPLPPKEAEDLKRVVFAEIAAQATREVVKVANLGKQLAPPQPLPTLATSQPSRTPPPAEPEAKPREKFPAGSVSRLLHERKAARESA